MKFCDDYTIPKSEHMPALEYRLSHFIATQSAASMGKHAMRSWLEGLQLWHQINEAPWHGGHMLRRMVTGAAKLALAKST